MSKTRFDILASAAQTATAAWTISGSGPSCTFSVKGIGEN